MQILLTGGAGYIGSHTAVELLNVGYEVIIADDFSNSSPKVKERIEEITGKTVKLYHVDVTDKEGLTKVFRENDIAVVIHFAGFKAVGESVSLPLKYYRNNLDTLMTLLEVMNEEKVHHVIFSSSATVYGDPLALPLTETMPRGLCTNPYGWTKWMIEQILMDFNAVNEDFTTVLLRYFNPVGAHPSALMGEAPNGIPNNLMPFITQVAVGKRDHLTIFGDDYPTPDGTCIRDYIHVVDLAKGHVAAVDFALKHKGTEIINLGTGCGYSVKEMVKTFASVNEVSVPYEIGPRRDGDLPEYCADAKKAKELLGWEAELTLGDMCRDSWRWQKKNPNGYED